MKVSASIRRLYDDQKGVNDRLQLVVDERIKSFKNLRWHYESRVKDLLSFALKIESGRFTDPHALEDFFACTLVVANATEIDEADRLIKETFTVESRRPQQPSFTHKASEAFPFDDLRLYARLREDASTLPTDPTGVLFEIQIKTFLQHAWSIATHDLVYKTPDPNWGKERIAYQIKAMLEHAEVSIQEAERISACSLLAKEDQKTAAIKKGIAVLKAQWKPDQLPEDIRRLAENVVRLLQGLEISADRLEEILTKGKADNAGEHPVNLSPYNTIVQYLLHVESTKMLTLLRKPSTKRMVTVLIPEEIEIPVGVDTADFTNAIIVKTSL